MDALSTAILMGLEDVVEVQVDHCLHIDWSKPRGTFNVFETTIRYLGGLISAVDLIKYVCVRSH